MRKPIRIKKSHNKTLKPGKKQITLFCVAPPSWADHIQSQYSKNTKDVLDSAYHINKDSDAPSSLPAPLTFTATKEEASAYIDQYLFTKYFSHFKRWCSLHGFPDPFADDAWDSYIFEVLLDTIRDTEDDLAIYELKYNQEQVARLMRLSCTSLPLSLPWEDSSELDNILSIDPQELSEDYITVLSSMIDMQESLCDACPDHSSYDHESCNSKDEEHYVS